VLNKNYNLKLSTLVSGFKSEPSSDEPSSDEPSSDEPSSDEPSSDEPSSDEPRFGDNNLYILFKNKQRNLNQFPKMKLISNHL
jgi:hypothetical protein